MTHGSGSRGPAIALVVAGVIGLLVAVGALVLVLTSGGDDHVETATGSTTTAPPSTTPATVTAPQTVVTPPPTAPTTSVATGSGPGPVNAASGLRGRSEVPYGSYVAMLWSEKVAGDSDAHAANAKAAKGGYYGVPTAVVYGDDFRSLKDGTIAVVYAGSFSSPRDAAQWCVDQGVTDPDSCIGVGLNDDFTPEDRNGTGRMYISDF